MGKITTQDISQQTDVSGLIRALSPVISDVVSTINGKILIPDNMDGQIISVNFSTLNQDTVLNHKIGRVPKYFLLVGATTAMSIYNGQTAASTTQFYLRSNAVGTANVFIF